MEWRRINFRYTVMSRRPEDFLLSSLNSTEAKVIRGRDVSFSQCKTLRGYITATACMEENHQLEEIIDTPRIINPLLLSVAAAKTTFDDDHTKYGFYSI